MDQYRLDRKKTFIRFFNCDGMRAFIHEARSIQDVTEERLEELYDNGMLDKLYTINKSVTQSLRCSAGRRLENIVEALFNRYGISYGRQVFIKDGVVSQKTRPSSGGHTVDFLVPSPSMGDSIEKYIHVSCKTTLRERVHQDQHICGRRNLVITYDKKTEQASSNGFLCITLERGHENDSDSRILACLLMP